MQARTSMAYSYSTKSSFSTAHILAEGTLYTTKRYTPHIYKYLSKSRYSEVKSILGLKRLVRKDQEKNSDKIYGKNGIVQVHNAKDSTKSLNPKPLSVNTFITQKRYGHKKSFNSNNRARASDKIQGEFMLSLLAS